LWRSARRLGPAARGRKRPPLLFFTDPARTPDPLAAAARLPRGAGVVFRSFGRADAGAVGAGLRALARRQGLVFLVGADARLSAALGADGVHLPERLMHLAPRLRRARPRWILTGAVHGRRGLVRARRLKLDAAVLSPVFDSRSPSATSPLGVVRFAGLVRGAGLPVYALGGVTARNAPRLALTGACGLAAVDGVNEVGGRPQEPQHSEP
jgi:thiamine-phosphate pyrophosphorylase